MTRSFLFGLALSAGCSAHAAPMGVALPPPSPPPPAHSSSASEGPSAAAPSLAPPALAPLEVHVEQKLALPVSSIALGEGTRIAVLADVPYVGDARGLRPLPLPPALLPKSGEDDEVHIFFGRDNEPRIMGARRSSAGERSIYWRHTAGAWRDGREEIGQLGSTTRGGLWGVLGSADPELVCRAGSFCIIKRTSGWTIAPAGSAPRQVALLDGTLWGLDASGLANIDARGWAVVMPAPDWSEPRAFWASDEEAWVASASELFRFHERVWSKAPLPVAEPAAFWGPRPDSIWLVGQGGAAHYDGRVWRSQLIAGPLKTVRGRGENELWMGGTAGLFRLSL